MWGDDEIAHARVVGEHDVKGWLRAAHPRALVEDVSDGLRSEGAPSLCLGEGGVEVISPVPVEQVQEPRRRAAEVPAVTQNFDEKGSGSGARGGEAIAATVIAGLPFLTGECSEVGLVFDLLA